MSNVLNLKPWPKGVSGNPAGRPKGNRNKLTEAFLEALSNDFDQHGAVAIEEARTKDPMGYVKTIASLCPRELDVKRPIDEMTDEELAGAIDALRSFIAGSTSQNEDGAGSQDAAESPQAPVV